MKVLLHWDSIKLVEFIDVSDSAYEIKLMYWGKVI